MATAAAHDWWPGTRENDFKPLFKQVGKNIMQKNDGNKVHCQNQLTILYTFFFFLLCLHNVIDKIYFLGVTA